MKYDYLKNMVEDVKDYIKENYEGIEEVDKESLYDDLFIEDSVTGNGSGSYTFNSEVAREFVYNNEDLLEEAMQEFGCSSEVIAQHIFDYEWQDVTIRCYLLGQAMEQAIEELKEEEEHKVFKVEVIETITHYYTIEANNEEEAKEGIEKLWTTGNIDYLNESDVDHVITSVEKTEEKAMYEKKDYKELEVTE